MPPRSIPTGIYGGLIPKAYPIWLRFSILSMMLVIALPNMAGKIGKFLSSRLEATSESRLKIIYAVLASVIAVLFIALTSHNHFLGDGYNVMGNIGTGRFFYTTEPFDFFVHQSVFRLFGSGEKAVYWSYALCSYACGIIFLSGLAIFIMDKKQLIFSLGIVSCFAAVQLFFGYVESYTFSFVLAFLYSFSAVSRFK